MSLNLANLHLILKRTVDNLRHTYRKIHSNSNQPIGTKEKETMRDIYVQLLPIILPKPSQPQGKILLCKWTSGVFEGRYTGIIKTMIPAGKDEAGPNLKATLGSVAKSILPVTLENNLDGIELVAVLRFDGPPECDEYVYLGALKDPGDKIIGKEVMNGDHPCFWFDWDGIPFDHMPADDAVWYPTVLGGRKKVKGFFNFGGWSERTIKSYELSVVEEL